MPPLEIAYLETSSINNALSKGKTGFDVSELVANVGFRPAIGIHTVYELARTFLDPDQMERGQALFTLLRDIDASFIPTTGQLIESELVKLRTGSVVMPFLDHDNRIATRYEIECLAQGFVNRATSFTEIREKERRKNEVIENRDYLQQLFVLEQIDPKRFKGIKTFEQTLEVFSDELPAIITAVVKRGISRTEAKEVSVRLDSFPCIWSLVKANLYLNFIMIRYKIEPSYDRLDDFRQVADAAYCKAFVTNDDQLFKTATKINDALRIIRFGDLI